MTPGMGPPFPLPMVGPLVALGPSSSQGDTWESLPGFVGMLPSPYKGAAGWLPMGLNVATLQPRHRQHEGCQIRDQKHL